MKRKMILIMTTVLVSLLALCACGAVVLQADTEPTFQNVNGPLMAMQFYGKQVKSDGTVLAEGNILIQATKTNTTFSINEIKILDMELDSEPDNYALVQFDNAEHDEYAGWVWDKAGGKYYPSFSMSIDPDGQWCAFSMQQNGSTEREYYIGTVKKDADISPILTQCSINNVPEDAVGFLSFFDRVACVTESGYVLKEYDACFEGYYSDPQGSEENRSYYFTFTNINIPNNCVKTYISPKSCLYSCGTEFSVHWIAGLILDEWTGDILSLTIRMDSDGKWCYIELGGDNNTTRFVSIRDESLTPADVVQLANKNVVKA